MVIPMGIRYFAYPVSPRQIAQSHECPRGCFDGDDSWHHGEPGERPTLDLDKCYPELQWFLGGDEPRPSYALVEGAVTHTGYGWESFRRTLDIEQTKTIADDLDDLLASPEALDLPACRFGDVRDCAGQNLVEARGFARQVADAGFGSHYLIG